MADTVVLPGPATAATSDRGLVWIAAGGRLAVYDAAGEARWDGDAPAGVTALGAAGGLLAAVLDAAVVAWLDRDSGRVLARVPVGGDVTLAAGGGAVWAHDRRAERAWRVEPGGALGGPVQVAGVDRLAVDGDRLWWTSREDTLLRTTDRALELGARLGERGAIAACAGSVWISTPGALLRVGAWAGELGRPLPAPAEPATQMDCVGGMLAGGSDRTLFVLDPSVDADVRVLDAALEGELRFLLATEPAVWAIAAGRPDALVVRVRPSA